MTASILVTEDDEHFRKAVCRTLRSAGYAVTEAPNGAKAYASLTARAPDLLITDIMMPNGDGIELISATRRNFPKIRMIAISGRGRLGALDILNMAFMLGADATLAKPFSGDELLAQVAELLAGERKQEAG